MRPHSRSVYIDLHTCFRHTSVLADSTLSRIPSYTHRFDMFVRLCSSPALMSLAGYPGRCHRAGVARIHLNCTYPWGLCMFRLATGRDQSRMYLAVYTARLCTMRLDRCRNLCLGLGQIHCRMVFVVCTAPVCYMSECPLMRLQSTSRRGLRGLMGSRVI